MGRSSRQRPVRRAVRVKTVQRVPRPLSEAQVAALLQCRHHVAVDRVNRAAKVGHVSVAGQRLFPAAFPPG